MNPVLYVKSNLKEPYEEDSLLVRIKDRFSISLRGESFVKELGLNIASVKLPPNFNKKSYLQNMEIAKKYLKGKDMSLAPKTFRNFDYELLNSFQKNLFAYGVIQSVQLMLRMRKKSIKNSCIVIYDAAHNINSGIIFELAKRCKYCVLLSRDLKKISEISDYVIANYGISPIVTNDFQYALNKGDFIISSENIENKDKFIWYINNMYIPKNINTAINDVTYSVPWQMEDTEITSELLGAILSQMEEKDVESSLKYNGIYLDKIKFNEDIKE